MDFIILVEVILVSLVLIYALYLFNMQRMLRKDRAKFDKEMTEKLLKVNRRSQKLLQEAVLKSHQILENTKLFRKKIEEESEGAMDDTYKKFLHDLELHSHKVVVEYENLFDELEKDYQKEEISAFNLIEKVEKESIEDLKKQITKKVLDLETELATKVEKEFEDAKKDIQTYKNQKISEADKNIIDAVNKISLEVLGKGLNLENHKDLVIEALENAKKEGLL